MANDVLALLVLCEVQVAFLGDLFALWVTLCPSLRFVCLSSFLSSSACRAHPMCLLVSSIVSCTWEEGGGARRGLVPVKSSGHSSFPSSFRVVAE